MRSFTSIAAFALPALAAREFLNEPDTGFAPFIPTNGSLPPLDDIHDLTDFDAAARSHLNTSSYVYYRNGVAGEWSYRNNLEAFSRIRLRPRVLVDVIDIESTFTTTILGNNYSSPFFIAPCARGAYGNPADGELGLVRGAQAENVMYIPSFLTSLPASTLTAAQAPNLTWGGMPQQLYIDNNDTTALSLIRSAELEGRTSVILTVDSAGNAPRTRAARYGQGSADDGYTLFTWERFQRLQNMTSLTLVPKGIMSVEDARTAVSVGCKAIYLSNHGGRQLDYSPSPLEIALEIYQEAPEIFEQVEVWADGGVRYGTDVLKLLALGVKAVGLGRPFMYANAYGEAGVRHAIQLLRDEIAFDAANMGVGDLKNIDASYLKLDYQNYNGWHP